MYEIVYSSQAKRDGKKLSVSNLKSKCQELLNIIANNPYEPPYEKLGGDMSGFISAQNDI